MGWHLPHKYLPFLFILWCVVVPPVKWAWFFCQFQVRLHPVGQCLPHNHLCVLFFFVFCSLLKMLNLRLACSILKINFFSSLKSLPLQIAGFLGSPISVQGFRSMLSSLHGFLHRWWRKAGGSRQCWLTVLDRSRGIVMNTNGSLYSVIVVNQPKKIIQINTEQTNIWGVFHNTAGKINDNIYIHCLVSADHGFGCLRIFLVCPIEVHPSARLLVYWVWSGLGGGGVSG
jgi:hypothetical protein